MLEYLSTKFLLSCQLLHSKVIVFTILALVFKIKLKPSQLLFIYDSKDP